MAEQQRPTVFREDHWHAIATDEDGFVMSHDELAQLFEITGENAEDGEGLRWPDEILIVTGTAVPRSQSDDPEDFHRQPGVYLSEDVIAEWDVYGADGPEIKQRLGQAQSMAAAHNKEVS